MDKILLFLCILFSTFQISAQTLTPWWQQTTVYQIYPRSFYDSNNDGTGDIAGIISKLDYIHDLGFETIWVSPFFSSPQQDFGYDVSDYLSIDADYGTMEDCQKLIEEVHQRDMKIIFDLVMNHTSEQHEWFQQSASSKAHPKRDWYIWKDGRKPNGKKPPNNWKSMTGGSGWHYDENTRQWYWATFLPFQPDLNYHNPGVRDTMLSIAQYWMDEGVDGFRLDIFNCIYEDSSFRDNPFSLKAVPSEENPNGFFQKTTYTQNHPQSFAFAKELRAAVEEVAEEPFLVGEVFGSNATIKKFCGDNADGLNTVFIFKTLKTKFKAKDLYELLTEIENTFPDPFWPTYVFSNHDKVRSMTRLGNDTRKAKLLAMMQFTVRGTPFTYYGEEIGMQQASIPLDEGKDPLAEKYEWVPQWLIKMSGQSLNRDNCRTPMQWDQSENAGFCEDCEPWLPINTSHEEVNVAAQKENPNSLLNFYRQLLHIRQNTPALHSGKMEVIGHNNKVLRYSREMHGERFLILLNFSNKKKEVNLPQESYLPVLSTSREAASPSNGIIELEGLQGIILQLQ